MRTAGVFLLLAMACAAASAPGPKRPDESRRIPVNQTSPKEVEGRRAPTNQRRAAPPRGDRAAEVEWR